MISLCDSVGESQAMPLKYGAALPTVALMILEAINKIISEYSSINQNLIGH